MNPPSEVSNSYGPGKLGLVSRMVEGMDWQGYPGARNVELCDYLQDLTSGNCDGVIYFPVVRERRLRSTKVHLHGC
jgi:hypothetical protein